MGSRALEAIPYSPPLPRALRHGQGQADRARAAGPVRVGRRRAGRLGRDRGALAARAARRRPSSRARSTRSAARCWTRAGSSRGRIWSGLARCRSRGASAPALAALDIALHDLAGKAAGVPVWTLLGRRRAAARSTCNATLPAGNPATLRALAERWAGRRLPHLQAQGRRRRRRRPGRGDAGAARRRGAAAGRRERGLDTRRGRRAAAGDGPHTIELAEEPVSGLEQLARCAPRPGSRWPPTRASPARATPGGRSSRTPAASPP